MATTRPNPPQVEARVAEPDGELHGLVFLLLILLVMVPIIAAFTS
jgi:hypothetical protein